MSEDTPVKPEEDESVIAHSPHRKVGDTTFVSIPGPVPQVRAPKKKRPQQEG